MTPEQCRAAKRLLWENALLAMLPDPRMPVKRAAELADEAVKEWEQRFEKGAK